MEWFLKCVLTMGSVALVLTLAERWGRGVAGLVSGLPIITAPALAWLALDRGLVFAADAAVAAVSGCVVLAAFVWGYAHAARRGGRAPSAIACGGIAALLVAWPSLAVSKDLPAAALLSIVGCALAWMSWPRTPRRLASAPSCSASPAFTAAMAGGFSASLSLVGPALGVVAAGMLSSLPVVSLAVAVAEHTIGGQAAVQQFLRGCMAGLFGRIAFGVVFALSVTSLHLGLTLLLSVASAGAVNMVGARRLGMATSGRDANGQEARLPDVGHVTGPIAR